EDGKIKDLLSVADSGYLLMPGELALITEYAHRLYDRYPSWDQDKLIEHASLPSFPDVSGIVVLIDSMGKVLDSFAYNENMHHPYLSNTEGVSLERISPFLSTSDRGNWTSASASIRFGSPGKPNSQFIPTEKPKEHWHLESGTFSPDGDGFEDLLLIHYSGLAPGTTLSIQVVTLSGVMAAEIANNYPCG